MYDCLSDNLLLEEHTATKKALLDTYEEVRPFFEGFYSTKPRKRYVDFNQGIDARLITDENMAKLAEIPVRPVRIAFDHWSLHEKYEAAVRTAVRHGHTNLSNYILYNFEDKPVKLYQRLRLNVDLCEELGASIYSFPMKYHPIEDPDYFSNRDYIGKHWNRKFIRTIQAVLNSTNPSDNRPVDEEYDVVYDVKPPQISANYFPSKKDGTKAYRTEMEEAYKAGTTVQQMIVDILSEYADQETDFNPDIYSCLDTDANVTFAGKHFVLSGFRYTVYENSVIAEIEKRGGIVHSSMVKMADYLVVNLRNPGVSKIKKALEWRQKGATNLIVSDYQLWQAIFNE